MAAVLCVGQATWDFIFSVNEMPRRAEKYQATAFNHSGGGPAAGAAATIAKLGGKARLAARFGNDNIADLIVTELEAHGVDCAYIKRFSDCSSSISTILMDKDGERLIVNYLDPNLPAAADWLPDSIPAGTEAVLADTRWPQGAKHILNQAKIAGIPAVLDADTPIPKDDSLPKVATHIAFSAAGLRDFAGHNSFNRALQEIHAETGIWCCVTLGGDGVSYVEGQRIRHLPALPIKPVDTLGAGDIWHGAFTLALAEGKNEVAAVEFASVTAALKVQSAGGYASLPERNKIDTYIARNN